MQIVATVATNNRTGDGARENKSAYRGLDSTWKFRPGIYLNHASFPLARRSNPIPSADKSGNLVGRGGEGREKWPTNRSWLEKRIIIRAGGRALYLHIGGADNDGAGFKLKCCLPRYLNTAAALCLSRVASSRVESRGESFPLGRRHSMDFEGKGLKGDVDDFRRWSKCWGIRG